MPAMLQSGRKPVLVGRWLGGRARVEAVLLWGRAFALGSTCIDRGPAPCSARHPLLDSRPACEEGSCMDPARFPHAPHPLAADSQTPCGKTP
jgi:hypothetical protein